LSFSPRQPVEADALLFDMDGTLLLSHAVAERIWRRWAAANGVDGEEIIANAHGVRMIDTMRRFCPPGLSPEVEAARLDQEEREDTDGIVAIAGAAAFLASLPEGRWAIVTSADPILADIRLRAAGLTPPPVLITAHDVTRGKPDPQGFREAARRLGFAAENCVVFEDAPAGIAAGEAAGAHVVVLSTLLKPEALEGRDSIADYSRLVATVAEGGRIVIS
jgi:sugar-phosphatase